MVPCASVLYSSGMPDIPAPWEAARDLRWRAVRDVVLDPIAMLGTVVVAWALVRSGAVGPEAAVLLFAAFAIRTGDELLFTRPDGELLRVHPLGLTGFLKVRLAELGWWLHPPRVLLAACVGAGYGFWFGIAAWALGGYGRSFGLWGAIHTRRASGRHGGWVWLPGAAAVVLQHADVGAEAVLLGAAGVVLTFATIAPWAVEGAYLAHFDRLVSDAATAPRSRTRVLWSALRGLSLPIVDRGIRSRLVRDAVLTLRLQDPQGAILLLLAPLSCLLLVGELETLPTPAAMPWRTLTCAALGGAAVAYGTGPGIHRLRMASMPWERTSAHPGRRALASALVWALGLATLHGAATLATVALTQGGRFSGDVAGLALPVLGLEWAMAHFVVVQVFANQRGKRILGEGTLVLSLPVVAITIAVAGVLMPALIPVYFIVTAGMTAAAAARYDAVEVTW